MTLLSQFEWALNLNAVKDDVRDLLEDIEDNPELEVDLDRGVCILTTDRGTTEYEDIPQLIVGLTQQGIHKETTQKDTI